MRKCRVWCPEDEEDEREKTTTKKREEDEDEADEEQEEEEDEEEEDEEEEEEEEKEEMWEFGLGGSLYFSMYRRKTEIDDTLHLEILFTPLSCYHFITPVLSSWLQPHRYFTQWKLGGMSVCLSVCLYEFALPPMVETRLQQPRRRLGLLQLNSPVADNNGIPAGSAARHEPEQACRAGAAL